MKPAILFTSAFLIFLCAPAAAQTISGSLGDGSIERGEKARGVITMTIPGGLHVNSNRPSSEYAIATTVRVSGRGLRIGGVNYPRGRDRKFQFSENLINVYEGRVRFPFSVTVPPGFRGNVARVRAVVRYQACTEEVCYPPRSRDVIITARVR
jgi:hypothetical protein